MTPNIGDHTFEDTGERPIPDGCSFALLLTHDIDRPYKTYQSLYYALTADTPARRNYHLSTLRPGVNPYWQFENIMALESDLGVRSAFYVLDEQHILTDRPRRELFSVAAWSRYAGRYRLDDDRIQELITTLDANGWEVGLHGSYDSYDDPDRLAREKARVESVLGHAVTGGRQHHLNLKIPDTWRYHRAMGLSYDTSLGSSDTYGFQHGYGVQRPFGDEFVVFPLTIMEQALPDPGTDYEAARDACHALLHEAKEEGAVMTVLWHPRTFNVDEFPGHKRLYRDLVSTALEMDAWVGTPGEFYEEAGLDQPKQDVWSP